jgi:hypothetical protein
MNITTERNVIKVCKLSGQGLTEGVSYKIHKINVIDSDSDLTSSAAWVYVDGELTEIKNAHLAFGLFEVA